MAKLSRNAIAQDGTSSKALKVVLSMGRNFPSIVGRNSMTSLPLNQVLIQLVEIIKINNNNNIESFNRMKTSTIKNCCY